MKKLTLTLPTIFLMVGIPGAGKSFFARQFAADLVLPLISADRIRHELFNEPSYSQSEQAIVGRMIDYICSEMLNSQSSFILDSQFANTRTARLNIERRARASGYRVVTIWVQVDKRSAKNRSLNRKSGKRDDLYNPSLPEKAFIALSNQLVAPNTEPHVVISGRHTFAAQKSAVLNRLVALYESAQESSTSAGTESSSTASDPGAQPKTMTIKVSGAHSDGPMKVITPTPTRTMDKPAKRGDANRKIIIS